MAPRTLPPGEFYGTVLKSRNVAGLFLTETGYPADVRVPRHSHTNAYLCLVRQGAYTEYYGGRSRSCAPLTLAYHPPGEVHSEDFHGGPGRSFNIELAADWLHRLGPQGTLFAEGLHVQGGEPAVLALKLFHEFDQRDDAAVLAIEGLTLELLAAVSRGAQLGPEGRHRPPWLERAWQMIQDRYRESLTLTDLARAVAVHPVHLATTFRRFYGCTVGDALRRRRLEYATQRLIGSDDSLGAIAVAAGFADQSHFSNTFKKQVGMTPSAFRRSSRTGG